MIEREIISLFHGERGREKKGELIQNASDAFDSLDDCVLIQEEIKEGKKIVTTDSMVEGIHFRLEWSSPEDLAVKLFQNNLSDIISSGGKATWCLLNLGLPLDIARGTKRERFLERFASTLRQECWRHRAPLLGGDTFRSDLLFLSLSMGGRAERYIQRSGAQLGDHLYVTGDLGLSMAGLSFLEGKLDLDLELQSEALEKHLQPQARVEWGETLRRMPEVHAMTDLSDGLLSDAIHLARANNMELCINLEMVPLNAKLLGKMSPQDAILSGEELELLFLAPPDLRFSFPCKSVGWAEKLTSAGEGGVKLLKGGKDLPFPLGRFEHF